MLTFSTIGGPPYPAVRPTTSRAATTAVPAAAASGASVVIRRHLPEIRVDDSRVATELVEWSLGDHSALSHHDHLVRDPLDEREVVFDDDHRRAGGDETEHGGRHALAEDRVDSTHRFIEDEQQPRRHETLRD